MKIFIFSSILLFLTACVPDVKPVGGPCTYEDFETEAIVDSFEFNEDNVIITFQMDSSIHDDSNTGFMYYADKSDTLFTKEKLENPDSRYTIEGKQIIKGSCTPTTSLRFSWKLNNDL